MLRRMWRPHWSFLSVSNNPNYAHVLFDKFALSTKAVVSVPGLDDSSEEEPEEEPMRGDYPDDFFRRTVAPPAEVSRSGHYGCTFGSTDISRTRRLETRNSAIE